VPEWSPLFNGDDRADSITWDPHKQFGAPIPNSVLFVQNKADFGRVALHSGYFNRADDVEPNPGLKSPPSTRPLAALPLVTLMRGQGLNRVIENLRAPLVAIRALADYLHDQPDVEVCHQPDTGILCFRMMPEGLPSNQLDAFQRDLYQQVMASGERSIAMTTLNGKVVLRLVIVSPHTKIKNLQETIDVLRHLIKNRKDY
jgi:aromatic-L-amino-acid decarboxylase